jgi:hypothetical protein
MFNIDFIKSARVVVIVHVKEFTSLTSIVIASQSYFKLNSYA